MRSDQQYRINGFDQIKAFYSWLFNNQDKNISTTHVSLYLFLINQNNRSNWVEWFKCPYDLGMAGSCIGSRNTYYKCLEDLKSWNLIDYQKGVNNYKAPLIKLCLFKNDQLTEQVPVPLSEPLTEHVTIPLSEPLTEHIYKLLTSNIKLITDNIEEVLGFLQPKVDSKILDQVIDTFKKEYEKVHEDYSILNPEKERRAASIILEKYKQNNPNADNDQILTDLSVVFNACVNIEDTWWHNNMTLSLIGNKYNELKQTLKNGKSKQKSGASQEELTRVISKHFPNDGTNNNS